jgi:hypothetical protein
MCVAQPMRVKQKLYTNNHKENGSQYNCTANLERKGLDKQSPKTRKAPLLDSIPGMSHGCRLSIKEVA